MTHTNKMAGGPISYNGRPELTGPRISAARVKVLLDHPMIGRGCLAWVYFARLQDSAGAATSFFARFRRGDGISTANKPNFYNVDENLQSGYYQPGVRGEA